MNGSFANSYIISLRSLFPVMLRTPRVGRSLRRSSARASQQIPQLQKLKLQARSCANPPATHKRPKSSLLLLISHQARIANNSPFLCREKIFVHPSDDIPRLCPHVFIPKLTANDL